jgi:4-amino-4-deoxychorismate lyase
VIGSHAAAAPSAARFERGIDIVTCRTRLGENPKLAGLKHLCRLEQVMAQLELSDGNAEEGLLLSSQGRVVSATSNNVFVVYGDCVRTPKMDRCGVSGVMRRLVLEACPKLSLRGEESDLSVEQLLRADEMFLTNAVVGVQPVRALDGHAFEVGRVARRVGASLGCLPDA